MQMLLPLRCSTADDALALRSEMWCDHYRSAMPRLACLLRQMPARKGERVEDPYCRSGRCAQGAAVLADAHATTDAGRWGWARCAHCGGAGRHPMPEMAERSVPHCAVGD